MTDNEQNLLAEYRRLHDWLSDIVEDGERNRKEFPMGQLAVRLAQLDTLQRAPGSFDRCVTTLPE